MKDMIFPNCEKLGQTIIFVRTKETSRQLHMQLQTMGFKITSIQVGVGVCTQAGLGCYARLEVVLQLQHAPKCCCVVLRAHFVSVCPAGGHEV